MTEDKAKIKFIRRPTPVIIEHRPIYKIGQVLLILYLSSRGNKSSLTRLHLFNWALKEKNRQQTLIQSLNHGKLKTSAWGFDPALAIALRFAIAENLVEEEQDSYKISELGSQLSKKIMLDNSLFSDEKSFLVSIKKSITEGMVSSVVRDWESL